MKEILLLMLVIFTWSLLLMLAALLWGRLEYLHTLVPAAMLSALGAGLAAYELLHPVAPKDGGWRLRKSG